VNANQRLRALYAYAGHLFPDCQTRLERTPFSNSYVLQVRIPDTYVIDPPPVGLYERDWERLVQAHVD
jgi:hypothetical protein